MFKRLEQHWRVNSVNLALIITTFALGGSACGFSARKLLIWLQLEKGVVWWLLYLLLVFLLWPICVTLISIPLGQFGFFKRYINRIWNRVSGKKKTRVAIFASGAGSNAQEIINYFYLSGTVNISLIVCNKPGAGVISIANKEKIPCLMIKKEDFLNPQQFIKQLSEHKIDFMVLAGFLWKIPEALIKIYLGKIVNIHPALLPKYGGPGMYGHFVHEAVIANHEKESGISIHFVDEQYDHGKLIFQAICPVNSAETPQTLAQKIHELEHKHYPEELEKIITSGK